ncbi:MAG: hypothetical protein ACLSCQ_15100 [Evtepia gabavorous]
MEARQNTLTITGLRTEFLTPEGPLAAVDGVDLAIPGGYRGAGGGVRLRQERDRPVRAGPGPPRRPGCRREIRFGETDLRTLGEGRCGNSGATGSP